MSADLLLQRHPDARRGSAPLLEPILLPYLALMFGTGVAALAACYNAIMLRRGGLALKSVLVAIAAWAAFLAVLIGLRAAGLENLSVGIIAGRIMHFAFGGLLYMMQRPHFRGHRFLDGSAVPLLPSYLVAILLAFNLPVKLALLLLGVPIVQ